MKTNNISTTIRTNKGNKKTLTIMVTRVMSIIRKILTSKTTIRTNI